MEKARACTQMVSSKTAQELEMARYRIPFCHFPLMFHKAERLLHFDISEVIFNKFDDNFVFACSFSGKLPFCHDELTISSCSSLNYSYYLLFE